MGVSEIQLYELLKAKLGEKEASAFMEILEKWVDRKFEENRSILAIKKIWQIWKAELVQNIPCRVGSISCYHCLADCPDKIHVMTKAEHSSLRAVACADSLFLLESDLSGAGIYFCSLQKHSGSRETK